MTLSIKEYDKVVRKFVDDYDMTEEDKVKFNHQLELELHDLALGVWEADNEDDLIDEITTATGWCIKSIDYDIQLK